MNLDGEQWLLQVWVFSNKINLAFSRGRALKE